MNTNKAIAYGVLLLLLGGLTGYCFGLNRGLEQGTAISDVSLANPPHQATEAPAADGLKTFNDPASGLSFQYPADLGTAYITPVAWPPKAAVTDGAVVCPPAGKASGQARSEKRQINGREMCVTSSSEGAAGSTYADYAYAFTEGSKTVTLAFTLRFPQCANYDEPERSACTKEQDAITADSIIGPLVSSLIIK